MTTNLTVATVSWKTFCILQMETNKWKWKSCKTFCILQSFATNQTAPQILDRSICISNLNFVCLYGCGQQTSVLEKENWI